MLSTPPAFILSQDQTLVLIVSSRSKSTWLILTVLLYCFGLSLKDLFWNFLLEFFRVALLFSFQGSFMNSHCFEIFVLSAFHTRLDYSITSYFQCQHLFSFFYKKIFLLKWKVYFHFEWGKVDFSLSLISTSSTVVFSLTLYIPDSHWKGRYIWVLIILFHI